MAGKAPGSSLACTPAESGLRWRFSPATTPSCHFRCGALSTAPMTNWTFSFIRPSRIPRPVENLTPSERNHLHQTARGEIEISYNSSYKRGREQTFVSPKGLAMQQDMLAPQVGF